MKMKNKFLVVLILCFITFIGCGKKEESNNIIMGVNQSDSEQGNLLVEGNDKELGQRDINIIENNLSTPEDNYEKVGKTFISGEYEYTILEDLTAEISCYNGTAENLEIPQMLDGFTVSQLGESCFSNAACVKNLTIPGNVKVIKANALGGIVDLDTLILEEGVERIEDFGLSVSGTIKKIVLPDSLNYVGSNVLYDVEYPEEYYGGLYYVGNVVYKCDCNVNSFTFKEGTIGIAGGAFWGYDGVTEINIPEGVKFLGENAFYDSSIEIYYLPESLKEFGEYAIGYEEMNYKAKPMDIKIYGKGNSYAEQYANTFGFRFVTMQ